MRVLLIWPHSPETVLNESLSCCEPLPLEYLAGALKDGHDVTIHDMRLDGAVANALAGSRPQLIGIAIPYTTAIRAARSVAREVRELAPEAPIVIGGHHPTVSSSWLDDFPADYIITGEGGRALRYLADSLARGGSWEMIPGLAPFSPGRRPPQPETIHSLDELSLPDRSATSGHRDKYFHSIYRPVALVRFSAGCPYRCTFCILWRMHEQRYLTKHDDRILAELAQIDVDNVYVVDDEAFIQPARMARLAGAISDSGIRKKYHMYLRSDTAVRNPTLIEQWAEIGLDSVMIGAESMQEQDLLDYKKALRSSDTCRALRLFHSLGIKVRANFIVRPDYCEADFERLAETVRKLEIDLPSFAVLTPLPGTLLFEERRAELAWDNPDLFDCYHTLFPTRLPIDKFYDSLASLLEWASCRNRPAGGELPGVFYFSSGHAFERMLAAIRNGSRLHENSWSRKQLRPQERTTPCLQQPQSLPQLS
jgi:methyltransferase